HDPLERGAFAYDGLFYDQTVGLQIGVVLRVSNRTLQGLVDQKRRFLRCESQKIERRRNRQPLDLTRDFARLKRRNPVSRFTILGSRLSVLILRSRPVVHPPANDLQLLFYPSLNPFPE